MSAYAISTLYQKPCVLAHMYLSIHVHCTFQEIVFASGIENRVDPDQLAPQKGADLELLALATLFQIQIYPGSTW